MKIQRFLQNQPISAEACMGVIGNVGVQTVLDGLRSRYEVE